MAGDVHVGERPARKPGEMVAEDADLRVSERPAFVSRGGVKLANALDAFALGVEGRRALDVGASTGGVSGCLPQRLGARLRLVGAARPCGQPGELRVAGRAGAAGRGRGPLRGRAEGRALNLPS